MPVFTVDGDILIGIVFIVESADETFGTDIRILGVFQLSMKFELGGEAAQLLFVEQLTEIDLLGQQLTFEELLLVHVELDIHVAGSRLHIGLEIHETGNVTIECTVHRQTAQPVDFLGDVGNGLRQEVDAGLRHQDTIHLQMPGGLTLPVL